MMQMARTHKQKKRKADSIIKLQSDKKQQTYEK